jgi:hypothetical protein
MDQETLQVAKKLEKRIAGLNDAIKGIDKVLNDPSYNYIIVQSYACLDIQYVEIALNLQKLEHEKGLAQAKKELSAL